MPKHTYITPSCCEKAKSNAIVLSGRWESDEEAATVAPKWVVSLFKDELYGAPGHLCMPLEADYCPFCGEKLPDVEIDSAAKLDDIYSFDDNYCGNCGERNSVCSCLQPEFRWKSTG